MLMIRPMSTLSRLTVLIVSQYTQISYHYVAYVKLASQHVLYLNGKKKKKIQGQTARSSFPDRTRVNTDKSGTGASHREAGVGREGGGQE